MRPSSDKVHRKHHKLSLQSNSLQLSLSCIQIKEQILGYDTTDTTPTGECAKMHLFVKNEPVFQSKHHLKYNTYLVKHNIYKKNKQSQTLSQHVNRIVTQAWRTCIKRKRRVIWQENRSCASAFVHVLSSQFEQKKPSKNLRTSKNTLQLPRLCEGFSFTEYAGIRLSYE